MNKRMKKKYLTDEEQTVIKLFRECQDVAFYKHRQTIDSARNFVSILNDPKTKSDDSRLWFTNEKGKIEATAFLKK